MSARQRDSIERSPSSDSQMTFTEFLRLFPDNDACLTYLKERFYPDGTACPKCDKASRFHRITGRSAFSCQFCGHHVYPTAGTIFHKSTTSLQLWFWAIYLMSSTRCGISAKQLGREIGVTYKTAWRMFHQIRTLLGADFGPPLTGKVEVDETGYGGKPRLKDGPMTRRQCTIWAKQKKVTIFGMVEREGRVRARVVPDRSKETLFGQLRASVAPAATIYSDEWALYAGLGREFAGHLRIKHADRKYVDGDVHTQTIEGFWALVKTGILGVYHSVSAKHLQAYVDEYAFRYSHRKSTRPMFWLILDRVAKEAGLPGG